MKLASRHCAEHRALLPSRGPGLTDVRHVSQGEPCACPRGSRRSNMLTWVPHSQKAELWNGAHARRELVLPQTK